MAIYMCDSRNCTTTGYGACTGARTSYEGCVLDMYERNGYNDSDFLALVWDEGKQAVTTVEYGTTRFWTYHNNAEVDANPDTIEKAMVWYRAMLADMRVSQAHREATNPRKGDKVSSTTTRGKNKGIVGEIVWVGEDGYSRPWSRYVDNRRFGIRVDGEDSLRYLNVDQVKMVSPRSVDEDAIRLEASQAGPPHNWRSATYTLFGVF